jgi:hypothetical protein
MRQKFTGAVCMLVSVREREGWKEKIFESGCVRVRLSLCLRSRGSKRECKVLEGEIEGVCER